MRWRGCCFWVVEALFGLALYISNVVSVNSGINSSSAGALISLDCSALIIINLKLAWSCHLAASAAAHVAPVPVPISTMRLIPFCCKAWIAAVPRCIILL